MGGWVVKNNRKSKFEGNERREHAFRYFSRSKIGVGGWVKEISKKDRKFKTLIIYNCESPPSLLGFDGVDEPSILLTWTCGYIP